MPARCPPPDKMVPRSKGEQRGKPSGGPANNGVTTRSVSGLLQQARSSVILRLIPICLPAGTNFQHIHIANGLSSHKAAWAVKSESQGDSSDQARH
eukprot:6190959-Pleurochrysis_carterae.AAC.1